MAENSSASIQMFMQAQSSVGAVGTLTNHDTVLLSNNTERARVNSSGLSVTGTVSATSFSGGGLGKVLQVVQGSTTSGTNTSSTSYQATGITASITPSSTSSKIYAMVSAPTESQTAASVGSNNQLVAIFRGGTEIASTNIGTREANGFSDYVQGGTSLQWLDSPSTTSSVTYTVYVKSNHSSTVIKCPSGGRPGVITLMEISS
jgi:hypothetical protein